MVVVVHKKLILLAYAYLCNVAVVVALYFCPSKTNLVVVNTILVTSSKCELDWNEPIWNLYV